MVAHGPALKWRGYKSWMSAGKLVSFLKDGNCNGRPDSQDLATEEAGERGKEEKREISEEKKGADKARRKEIERWGGGKLGGRENFEEIEGEK